MNDNEMLPEIPDYWDLVDAVMDDIRLEEYREMSDYTNSDLRAGEPSRA